MDRRDARGARRTGVRAGTNDPRTRRGAGEQRLSDRSVTGLRVALFVNSVEMGGVEEHVRQLAAGLAARGAEVLVICPETPRIDAFAAECARSGADVVRVTLSRANGTARAARRALAIARLLRERRIEVAHLHLIGWGGGRWAVAAARLGRVRRVLCTVHLGVTGPVPWWARLERRIWSRAVDRFVAVSESTRRAQIRLLRQPAAKTVTIPNGVELARHSGHAADVRDDVRRAWGIAPTAAVIGTVGRLAPQKAVHILVRALPDIARAIPDVRVLIIGDGPERDGLDRLATEEGVRDRIVFAGARTDVPRQLAAMDVFVLPSLFEGLPLSVLEAMAAGLPVVASAVDGVPEVVEEGVTGHLVIPEDPGVLADRVIRVLADRERAAAFGRAARSTAARYSTDTMVERVIDTYRPSAVEVAASR